MRRVAVAPPEPRAEDIDQIIRSIQATWTATVTVRRQSPSDIGYRQIILSLDGEELGILRHGEEITRDLVPGRHRLQANNTLFRKTLDFALGVGEHAVFSTVNRAGFGTYSLLAFFLGGGPLYLTLERDSGGTYGS